MQLLSIAFQVRDGGQLPTNDAFQDVNIAILFCEFWHKEFG
jgi:hypothetical protein